MPKKNLPPVFKEYTMGQIVLLPMDLEEEIEPNHLVRVVNAAIEKMDLRGVYAQYKGGGTSSYHPKMLLKVLIYAYSQQIYSSRKIAKALRENIYFMWLSGNSHPDFHTINRFRGVVVKETIGEIFAAENMPYDAGQDTFTCPNGQQLRYKATQRHQSDNGFESERRVYQCQDCSQCHLKEKCTKAKGNRSIQVSFRLRAMRARAKDLLLSEQGTALRKQRSTDVETVFGRIKQDWGFRRFLLRGLKKVKAEWGLLCIAHNLAKLAVT